MNGEKMREAIQNHANALALSDDELCTQAIVHSVLLPDCGEGQAVIGELVKRYRKSSGCCEHEFVSEPGDQFEKCYDCDTIREKSAPRIV